MRSPASFRDPSGFVFEREGELFRQVNVSYRENYEHLIGSGLYADLTGSRLLVAHEEVAGEALCPSLAHKVIRPERIEFISYPYEWCFSALRDAALLTLAIQERALAHGMVLKDASAFNVQFAHGKPVFIDTLSFEVHHAGRPWTAYRQFCRHFLAPLALMSLKDHRLGWLQTAGVDGVPLDLASRLLPWRSWFRPGLHVHLHLHARMEGRHGPQASPPARGDFGKAALLGLVENLAGVVRGLRWEPPRGGWAGYEADVPYARESVERKNQLVAEWLGQVRPRTLWDLGANTGRFSHLASASGVNTVALDADAACVELLYRELRRRGDTRILPLVIDLKSPTPGLGWQGAERMSLFERGPAEAVLALALVHHLALGGNVPLPEIADFLARVGTRVAVEFVPSSDLQARLLLGGRDELFADYCAPSFERALRLHFEIERVEPIAGSERILYFLRRREPL